MWQKHHVYPWVLFLMTFVLVCERRAYIQQFHNRHLRYKDYLFKVICVKTFLFTPTRIRDFQQNFQDMMSPSYEQPSLSLSSPYFLYLFEILACFIASLD